MLRDPSAVRPIRLRIAVCSFFSRPGEVILCTDGAIAPDFTSFEINRIVNFAVGVVS